MHPHSKFSAKGPDIARVFTESLCSMWRFILSTVKTHTPICAVPFDSGAVNTVFKLSLLAHNTRGKYFYISVYALADTQEEKKPQKTPKNQTKKKANEKFINENWWRGIRCGLLSLVCTHNDPIAIEVFHFPQWGWLRQGHRTGTVLSSLSPNQLTKSVLAQSRQVTF